MAALFLCSLFLCSKSMLETSLLSEVCIFGTDKRIFLLPQVSHRTRPLFFEAINPLFHSNSNVFDLHLGHGIVTSYRNPGKFTAFRSSIKSSICLTTSEFLARDKEQVIVPATFRRFLHQVCSNSHIFLIYFTLYDATI